MPVRLKDMPLKSTVAVAAFALFAGPLSGQEVNSDVNIPTPREMVTGARSINGIFVGPDFLATQSRVLGGGTVTGSLGSSVEADVRGELGNFMTSLLVRAGVVSFDGPSLTGVDERAEDGSRPAWVGPTPLSLTISRTERAASVRRR